MSWLTRSRRARYWRWDVIAGVVTGFSTSLISISLARLVQQTMYSIPRVYAIRLKRAFFLIAYFSFVGWFAFQYGKKLGLPELFGAH